MSNLFCKWNIQLRFALKGFSSSLKFQVNFAAPNIGLFREVLFRLLTYDPATTMYWYETTSATWKHDNAKHIENPVKSVFSEIVEYDSALLVIPTIRL